MSVDFTNKKFKPHLSDNFKQYLNNRKDWFIALKNFRNALAHRIPPYMPKGVDPYTQEFVNFPIITHSYSEKFSQFILHPQILCDWATIIEFSNKFLEELETNP